jgi:hypothetical protein
MGDFLTFRRLITTEVIQVVFWLASIGIVIASIGAIAGDEPLAGILLLVFGLLYVRVLCEVFIVLFRMNDTLRAIKVDTAALPAAIGAGATTPAPATAVEAPAAAVAETPLPTEGWYDDSERPGHKRYWDGTAWGRRDDESPPAE